VAIGALTTILLAMIVFSRRRQVQG